MIYVCIFVRCDVSPIRPIMARGSQENEEPIPPPRAYLELIVAFQIVLLKQAKSDTMPRLICMKLQFEDRPMHMCGGGVAPSLLMKTIRTMWALVALFLLPTALAAQEASVEIATHPFDLDKARQEISAACARGYLPVGLEVIDGVAIHVLYVKNDALPFKQWFLYQLTDPEMLEGAVSYIIQDGWVPLDLAKTEVGLYLMFVKAEIEVEGWRITRSEPDIDSIKAKWAFFEQEGFYPWGISITDDDAWHLLLKTEGFGKTEASLRGYNLETDDISTGMQEDIDGGWQPWALDMGRQNIYILYTR